MLSKNSVSAVYDFLLRKFSTPSRKTLLKGGAWAFAIKGLSAILSFAMLAFLARTMTIEGFGVFGFAFSLGTLLAKGALLGQQQLVLKEVSANSENAKLQRGVAAHGYGVVAIGCAVAGLLLASSALITGDMIYLAVAAFVTVMAISELQTSLLRGHGLVALALGPREIGWRIAVIAFAAATYFSGISMEPSTAMLVIAVLLVGMVLAQTLAYQPVRPWNLMRKEKEIRDWRRSSMLFWFSSVVNIAAAQLSTVALAFLAAPDKVGPFFAALKSAQILNLFLLASNIVAAPLLSKAHALGDKKEMQMISAVVACLGTAFSFCGFLFMVFFGDFILTAFGEGFAEAYPSLVVLAAGYVAMAAFGPNVQALQMTGHEGVMLRILFVTNFLGLALLPFAIWAFDGIGAAAVVMCTMAVWNVWAWVEVKRRVGIDTSFLSMVGRIRISRSS
ncbi:oligosaccharide flippase family protein [Qipengyuania sp. XHP0207]|uniref:oligosaccharide flippase family protein n=1 Tax=Qipengyuania sp. XHP0207 TaxID=3038078 RepID=UPI00241F2593|nr:oligosaccharide flippase family protein [Qipengyuania sp. XHP0207]MDG5747273.1 oligosaccharide flippase family protein [Qipengyuania sp. XHP0207]